MSTNLERKKNNLPDITAFEGLVGKKTVKTVLIVGGSLALVVLAGYVFKILTFTVGQYKNLVRTSKIT